MNISARTFTGGKTGSRIIHESKKLFYLKFFSFIDSKERGRDGEREGEKHPCEREISISCILHPPRLGTEPATQACALTGNQTSGSLLCGMTPNQQNHTSQGQRSCHLAGVLGTCSWFAGGRFSSDHLPAHLDRLEAAVGGEVTQLMALLLVCRGEDCSMCFQVKLFVSKEWPPLKPRLPGAGWPSSLFQCSCLIFVSAL